jgi:hypothetical protein
MAEPARYGLHNEISGPATNFCAACGGAISPFDVLCPGCWEAKETAYKKGSSYAEVLTEWLSVLEARGAASGIPTDECRRRLQDAFFRPNYKQLRRDAEELT